MLKRLAIVGAGHLGQLIAYHASITGLFEIAGYFDDTVAVNSIVDGKNKALSNIEGIVNSYNAGLFDVFIVGIGYFHMSFRKSIYLKLSAAIPSANVIHPDAYIDPSCVIGNGIFIHPGCVLDRNVVLKDNVLLNTSCTIAHDSMISSHSFLAPRVAIAGFSEVGECCNLGINTTVIDNIVICNDIRTGAGCVVTKNLNVPGTYVGVPAKKIN